MHSRRPESVRLVSLDPSTIEFLAEEFASQSPEELFAYLEELMESGEYTEYEITLIIQDIRS